ncbi:alpha/beta hydrolase [Pseudidiomarina gelatinasegens]|jgi:pimeloyl-ACP methyl ester carboxylesterase|uniref:alpha/beta hydrolase n=1 Tax=Pseudidiomarina gelatinasegens TaxID=2487740 RepID=UPI0030ED86CC
MYRKLCFGLLAVTLLQGCATYVEHKLLNRVEPLGIPANMPEIIAELGGESRQFCMPHLGGCTEYLYGAPIKDETGRSFSFTAVGDDKTIEYKLALDRKQIPEARRGTMVMLHGYGGSKETMFFLADYYRFIGFHVVIPDLKGHGGSSHDTPGFAVEDADIITTLIDSLPARERPHPIYLTGFSMGALAAVHVARQRNDISGMVLLAPMRQFEDAVYEVTKMTYKNTSKIVSEKSIREGVRNALVTKEIDPSSLDLHQVLPPVKVPTLILASDVDPVGPYDYFEALNSRYVTVKLIQDRHHFLMGIMDPKMHEHLYTWLQKQR